jgi:hypothetical protein
MTSKEVLIILQQRLADTHRNCRGVDIAFDKNETYIDVQPLANNHIEKLGVTAATNDFTQFYIAVRSCMGKRLFDFIGINDINSTVDIIKYALTKTDAEINGILGQ